jgi:DNA ligase-1
MISVFTSSLRNITSTLGGPALDSPHASQKSDWIVDACLIGFQNGRICSTAEMMRHINRRRLSRKSSVSPAILAYDIIYQDGADLTGHPYQERRRRLMATFGEPRRLPFQGISAAVERILCIAELVEDFLQETRKAGGSGLICRDLRSVYYPGGFAEMDSLVGSEETISAAVVSAKYGRGGREKLRVKYEVALRQDEDLVLLDTELVQDSLAGAIVRGANH